MAKMDGKSLGLTLLLGVAVFLLTPVIAGFLAGISFMAFEIIPGLLSVGTALGAGVAAFVAQFAIEKWLK